MELQIRIWSKRFVNKSEKGVVTPANYNTPTQIVIGGEFNGYWTMLLELIEEAGARRLFPRCVRSIHSLAQIC